MFEKICLREPVSKLVLDQRYTSAAFPEVAMDVVHRAGHAFPAFDREVSMDAAAAAAAANDVVQGVQLILHPNPATLAALTFHVVGVRVGKDTAI